MKRHYWYSAKQHNVIAEPQIDLRTGRLVARYIQVLPDGRLSTQNHDRPGKCNNWDDAEYLGEFDSSEVQHRPISEFASPSWTDRLLWDGLRTVISAADLAPPAHNR
jgi:hypothetical protein